MYIFELRLITLTYNAIKSTGSAHAMVLTTISVSASFLCLPRPYRLTTLLSRTYPQGTRPRKPLPLFFSDCDLLIGYSSTWKFLNTTSTRLKESSSSVDRSVVWLDYHNITCTLHSITPAKLHLLDLRQVPSSFLKIAAREILSRSDVYVFSDAFWD